MTTPPRFTSRSDGAGDGLDADELLELGHGLSDLGRVDEAFDHYVAAGGCSPRSATARAPRSST